MGSIITTNFMKKEEEKKNSQGADTNPRPEKCDGCPVWPLCHGKPTEVELGKLVDVDDKDLPDDIRNFISDIEKLGAKVSVQTVAVPKKEVKYCSYCGSELIEHDVPAEKYGSVFSRFPITTPYSAFDSETGKKLFIKEYICPKWKGDSIFRDEKHNKYAKGKPFIK